MATDTDTKVERLTKRTTLLFTPDLYNRLVRLAEQRHSSVGELVREACRAQYSLSTPDERLAIVDELSSMSLPVGTPEEMERESVPSFEAISMTLVDSNVLMYAAGGEHPNKAPAIRFLRRVAEGEIEATVDPEARQEIIHRYRALHRWPDGRRVYALARKLFPEVLAISAQ